MHLISRLLGKTRQPDFQFAAEGYMGVAVLKRNKIEMDLHQFEQNTARALLADGCSTNQALSARWGSVCAIADNLSDFEMGIRAYAETEQEMGRDPDESVEGKKRKYKAAALMVMVQLHAVEPKEYERFLRYINA